MKRVVFIIIYLISLLAFLHKEEQSIVHAEVNRTYYARITNNETFLYTSPEDSTSSAMFILPQTYFVELLENANDVFYYARYNDIYGYVKKALVSPVKTAPQMPFLINISFRVFVPSGANLRKSPQNLGATNLVYSIPFLESNLLYYGIIYGEEEISKKGNVWYFCKYYVNNLSYTGYVYSPLCDYLGDIYPNEEVIELYEGNLIFKEEIQNVTVNQMETLSQTAQTIIIVAISLPCLLFIYLLFKPTKMVENASASKQKNTKHKQNKKISRLKHSDYFEFDDDFN